MPLQEQQALALPILDWLFSLRDEHRRTGRSHIIALALIRQAARSPRTHVRFTDHMPMRNMRDHVGQLVTGLATSDPRLSPHFTRTRDGFTLNLPVPIDDWLPREDRGLESLGDALERMGHLVRKSAPEAPSRSRWERLLDDDGLGIEA